MKRKGRKEVKWDFKKGDKMFKDWKKNETKNTLFYSCGLRKFVRVSEWNFLNYHLPMQCEPVITEQNVIRCSFPER
ncbi:hypothetical protein POTOM_046569 [Populus tomentosa]|uniref:Uncharacterized protein n=1 Tax=Populus tomentosa TaxID=118781 RepID=A0A8X7YH15_POPTO|nr:hypothetical protein POTOM_046569 [Populus tomentosa]